MHTPAGHVIRDGIAYPVDWLAIIFNPSFPYRFVHMMTAAYLTTSVVVMAVGARYLLAGVFHTEAKTMIRMGLGMVAILAPLQLFFGDQHGLNTLKHQPTKVAAMEGHWEDRGPAPLVLFGIPDQEAEKNHAEIAIPGIASLILTHSMTGEVPALKDVPAGERPPVANVFFAFRIMVGIGLLLILLGTTGALLWWRKRVFESRWFLRFAGHAWPAGFIAILAGWVTTESGRQPYVAHEILRTEDALSPVSAATVATSLVAFAVTYLTVFSIGVYYIRKLIRLGPTGPAVEAPSPQHALANRPLAHAQEPLSEHRSEEVLR
jgi:cytochrome d ubiquinol oxidase subunit I